MMKDREDITVPMPGRMRETVDEQLSYGDSRAGWIRDAIRQRLEREGVDVEGIDGAEDAESAEELEGNPQTAMSATSR